MRGWALKVVANPKGHRFAAAALVAAVWRAAILAALLDYTKRAVIVVVWARVPDEGVRYSILEDIYPWHFLSELCYNVPRINGGRK